MLVVLSGAAVLVPSTATAAGTLTLNITSPQHNEYVQTPYALLTWDANDTTYSISRYYVYVDDPTMASPVETTLKQLNLTGLADGQHTVVVRALNEVGGSAEDSVLFYINTQPPVLRIISPTANSWLNTSDVTVTWQASGSIGIAYFEARLDSNPWISPIPFDKMSNTFQNLTNGQHNITVMAHGWGGRTSTAVVAFNVDTTIPTVRIITPVDDAGFNHADLTVVWSGADAGNNIVGYQIWVDGVKVTTAVPGENHFNYNYADGHHVVRIVAVDIANSTAVDEVAFLVDTVVPTILSKSPSGGQEGVGAIVQVNFSKSMDAGASNLSIEGIAGSVSWDGTLMTFTPASPLAYAATYTVSLDARDHVGNVLKQKWTFTTTDMGTISGVITDAEGKPLAGVKVALDDGRSVVTNDQGVFVHDVHAGQYNLTLSKLGWDGKTMTVSLQPGQTMSVGSVSISPSNPLALYGVLAAIGAVSLVAIIYLIQKRTRKPKKLQHRSMKGMDDLQRRSKKGRREEEDDDRYL
ncbi:MAG: carboxypeptidase regulatory-like domain-containing protein [Methanomassiliicoccus sp.]|nr:carboxypeptidase regulatory-like domain-containing protein [Methanomassiliicoccus sp.]